MEERKFALSLVQDEGYQYIVLFDDPGMDPLRLDEPPPLGAGHAPNAVRLLGAAIGNCLAASLQFCLARARVEPRESARGSRGGSSGIGTAGSGSGT